MRKLLNTFYITNEQAYLSLDGENIVCKVPNEKTVRVPFDNIENMAQSLFLCDGSFLTYFLLLASMILRKKYSSSG